MKFTNKIREKRIEIAVTDYFDGKCPFCQSTQTIIRSSYIKQIPDLGNSIEKVIIDLTVAYYKCKACVRNFTPEHPMYPPNYQYSLTIIQHALLRYHYHNASGRKITEELRLLHNVDVKEATIYAWLKGKSPEFIKSRLTKDSDDLPSNIKAITVDGTYVDVGRDIIGKKKLVESLSVTKLEDGRYLLMWWE